MPQAQSSCWFVYLVSGRCEQYQNEIQSPQLLAEIEKVAEWSKRSGKPLVTTECWVVVDYKDWPLLNWDWILELNVIGVKAAVAAGR